MSLPDANLNPTSAFDVMTGPEQRLADLIDAAAVETKAATAEQDSLFGQLTSGNLADTGVSGAQSFLEGVAGVNFEDNLLTQTAEQFEREKQRFTDTFDPTVRDLNAVLDSDPKTVTGRGSGGPPRTSCEAGFVSGIMQAASGVASLAAADTLSAIRSSHMLVMNTVGAASAVGQAMSGALFDRTVARLGAAMALRGTTVDSLILQIDDAIRTIERIDAEVRAGRNVYETNNDDLLGEVESLLSTANSNLLGMENVALNGGGIPFDRYTAEEKRVTDAVNLLSNFVDTVPALVGVRFRVTLMAQRKIFEASVRTLRDSHLAFDILYKNAKAFTASLSQAKSKSSPNLVAPLLRQLRCRVVRVLSEIRQVRQNGTVIDAIAGRAKWTIELTALIGLSSLVRETLRANPDPSLSLSDTVNAAIAGVEAGLGDLDSAVRAEQKVTSFLVSASVFTNDLVRKAIKDVPSAPILARAASMKQLLEEIKAATPAAFDLLNQWTGDSAVASEIRAAVPVIAGLVSYYEASGADELASALTDGAFDTLLGLTPDTASSTGRAVAQIAALLADPTVPEPTKVSARRIKRFMDDDKEEQAIRAVFIANRPIKERRELEIVTVPDYQRLLADIKTVRSATGGQGFIAPRRVPPQVAARVVADVKTNEPSAVEKTTAAWAEA